MGNSGKTSLRREEEITERVRSHKGVHLWFRWVGEGVHGETTQSRLQQESKCEVTEVWMRAEATAGTGKRII